MKQSSTRFLSLQRSLRTFFLLPALALAALAGAHAAPKLPDPTPAAASVIYSTPYLQADPRAKNYHIPINIESLPGATLCDPAQMTIELRFYAGLFFPRSVTQGSIIGNSVSGTFRTITISLAGATPVANGALTEVVGDVMLGFSESTPLTLVSIKCGGVQVTDSIRSGDMSMAGSYCEEGSDRLLDYRPGFGITKVAPNPSRGGIIVNVRTVELDETSLEIYSSYGERVYTTSWIPASLEDGDMMKDITLPADLPNGFYEVVLRSPGRRDTETLIIAK
jgi:hypothetical protein